MKPELIIFENYKIIKMIINNKNYYMFSNFLIFKDVGICVCTSESNDFRE